MTCCLVTRRLAATVCVILLGPVALAACTATSGTPRNSTTPTGSSAALEPANVLSARLDHYLTELVGQHKFRGAVLVRRGQEVLLDKGYGEADAVSKTPNSPATRFKIASLTKQFTAAAVLVLQERGRLKVTDQACRYLAACPPSWAPITIEQLLTHTSGLFNYTEMSEAEAAPYVANPPSHAELTALIQKRPLLAAPGSGYQYTNSGYVVLGAIIERLTGGTYAQFLTTNILQPLGMAHTTVGPQPCPGHAIGYQNWTTPAPIYPFAVYADGALCSTTGDLARWNDFLLTGTPPLLTSNTRKTMLSPHAQVNRVDSYGYGIVVHFSGTTRTYLHNGRLPGYQSENEIHPDTHLSVTVLSNLDAQPGNTATVADALSRLLR